MARLVGCSGGSFRSRAHFQCRPGHRAHCGVDRSHSNGAAARWTVVAGSSGSGRGDFGSRFSRRLALAFAKLVVHRESNLSLPVRIFWWTQLLCGSRRLPDSTVILQDSRFQEPWGSSDPSLGHHDGPPPISEWSNRSGSPHLSSIGSHLSKANALLLVSTGRFFQCRSASDLVPDVCSSALSLAGRGTADGTDRTRHRSSSC